MRRLQACSTAIAIALSVVASGSALAGGGGHFGGQGSRAVGAPFVAGGRSVGQSTVGTSVLGSPFTLMSVTPTVRPRFDHRPPPLRPGHRPLIVAAPLIGAPLVAPGYFYAPPPAYYDYAAAYDYPPAYEYPQTVTPVPYPAPPQYVQPPALPPQAVPPQIAQAAPPRPAQRPVYAGTTTMYFCRQLNAYTNDVRYMECPEGWQQIAP